jgi:Flp pilus assembly protein TadG
MSGPGSRPRVRRGNRRSGQALVEFVLILPILLLLILGLVDFARAWSTHHALADAAREGTRMLVVNEGTTFNATEAAIRQRLATARLDAFSSRLTITFNPDDQPAGRGDPQTVTLDYAYNFWILGPFMQWATGESTVNLVSTITMRGE